MILLVAVFVPSVNQQKHDPVVADIYPHVSGLASKVF